MPDRHPAARGLGALVVVELHRPHEVVGDLAPLLVAQLALVGTQRQRAVPHVRRPGSGTDPRVGGLPVAVAAGLLPLIDRGRDLDSVELPRPVQVPRDRQSGSAVQLDAAVPRHQRVIASDQVRFLVLVVPALTGQVHHQSRHSVAADHVRHHGALRSSARVSMVASTSP